MCVCVCVGGGGGGIKIMCIQRDLRQELAENFLNTLSHDHFQVFEAHAEKAL